MSKATAICAAAFVLVAGAAQAQGQRGGGGLPQEAQRAMTQGLMDLQNQGALTTADSLAELVGHEKLKSFLDGAVVKLQLHPDGAFDAYCLEGGELVSIRLGKDQVTPPSLATRKEGWLHSSGELTPPKRAQKLSLTMRAGGQKVTVDCFNKYRRSEELVTYYVGPLDGLFCMGLSEDEKSG